MKSGTGAGDRTLPRHWKEQIIRDQPIQKHVTGNLGNAPFYTQQQYTPQLSQSAKPQNEKIRTNSITCRQVTAPTVSGVSGRSKNPQSYFQSEDSSPLHQTLPFVACPIVNTLSSTASKTRPNLLDTLDQIPKHKCAESQAPNPTLAPST